MIGKHLIGLITLVIGLLISQLMINAGDSINESKPPKTLEYEMNRPASEVYAIVREATRHPRVHEADTFVSDTLRISAVRDQSVQFHMKVTDKDKGIDVKLVFKGGTDGRSTLVANVDAAPIPPGRAPLNYVSDAYITKNVHEVLLQWTAAINEGTPTDDAAHSFNRLIALTDDMLRQWREDHDKLVGGT